MELLNRFNVFFILTLLLISTTSQAGPCAIFDGTWKGSNAANENYPSGRHHTYKIHTTDNETTFMYFFEAGDITSKDSGTIECVKEGGQNYTLNFRFSGGVVVNNKIQLSSDLRHWTGSFSNTQGFSDESNFNRTTPVPKLKNEQANDQNDSADKSHSTSSSENQNPNTSENNDQTKNRLMLNSEWPCIKVINEGPDSSHVVNWFHFRNTCAYPVNVHFCTTANCSNSEGMDTVTGDAERYPAGVHKGKWHVKLVSVCKVKSGMTADGQGGEGEVFKDQNNDCYVNVKK